MLDRASLQRLYRYGFSLTHDPDSAYDLLQDALETSLRKMPNDTKSSIAYLQRVMRNRFIDQYRHDNQFPKVSLDEYDDLPISIDPNILEDIIIAEEQVEMIMLGLEPLDRELLFFWAVEGYTAQEIADRIGSPRGTVLSRIHRLKQKITQQQIKSSVDRQGGVV